MSLVKQGVPRTKNESEQPNSQYSKFLEQRLAESMDENKRYL